MEGDLKKCLICNKELNGEQIRKKRMFCGVKCYSAYKASLIKDGVVFRGKLIESLSGELNGEACIKLIHEIVKSFMTRAKFYKDRKERIENCKTHKAIDMFCEFYQIDADIIRKRIIDINS